MRRITILSLNCFDVSLFTLSVRRRRVRKLVLALVKMSPDIICLQEIVFPDTTEEIRESLKKQGYSIFLQKRGIFTAGGLLTATKFPIKGSEYVKFLDQGKLLSMDIFEYVIQKGFHKILVLLPNGQHLTVVNMQLHCPFGAYTSVVPMSTSAHQYDQVFSQAISVERGIIAGDLNFTPANSLYKELTKTYCDPLAESSQCTITPRNTHRKFLPKFEDRIDYILLTPDLAHKTAEHIIFENTIDIGNGKMHHLSDHFGVWAEVDITGDLLSKKE